MKQKVGFLIGVVLLITALGIITITIVRTRTPKQGELKVESQPSASVFLDDKHIGRTPIGKTSYKIDAGEYTLKITPDTQGVTLVNFQEKIKISPSTLTYIDVSLSESDLTMSSYILWLEKMSGRKSELSVVTTPDGANILLDDEPKGVSPLIISDLAPGDHTLSVVSRGFITRTVKIKLNAGYRLIASVKLALAPGVSMTSDQTATVSGTPSPKQTPSGSPKVTPTKATGEEPTKPYALIKETPTGFLRVRSDAATTAAELMRVKPGEKYSILEEKADWFKIQVASASGWISSQYATKVE